MRLLLKYIINFILLATVLSLLLFPLYIMFKIAVSGPADIFTADPPYLIRNFTTAHFKDVVTSGETFYRPLAKSVVTALMASVLSLLIAIPAAYVISRFHYRLRYLLVISIFITRMIPEISIALPISISFMRLGLFDTTLGLVLAHCIRMLPVTCFILVSVFSSFPQELEEQAAIDGASRWRSLLAVIVPCSCGGIVVAGLFSFLLSWDEFIYASYLSLANPTMPIKMYYYVARGDIFYSATYAVIITLPVLILTCALQKYLRPDYLAGAVKG